MGWPGLPSRLEHTTRGLEAVGRDRTSECCARADARCAVDMGNRHINETEKDPVRRVESTRDSCGHLPAPPDTCPPTFGEHVRSQCLADWLVHILGSQLFQSSALRRARLSAPTFISFVLLVKKKNVDDFQWQAASLNLHFVTENSVYGQSNLVYF
jgi:hypothetical protein